MEGTSTNVEDYYIGDKESIQETTQQCIPLCIATSDIKLECKDEKEELVEDVKDEKEANDTNLMERTVELDMMSYVKREIPFDCYDSLNIRNETDREKNIFVGSTIENTESDFQNTFKKEKLFPNKDSMVKSDFNEEDKNYSCTCNGHPECEYNSLNTSENGNQCHKGSFLYSESTKKSELGYDVMDKDRNPACFKDIQGMYFNYYYYKIVNDTNKNMFKKQKT